MSSEWPNPRSSEHAHRSCPSSKMAASYGAGGQSPPVIGRPVDRILDDAQFTGEVNLSGRQLKDYPKISSKYDLADTIHAGKLFFWVFSVPVPDSMSESCLLPCFYPSSCLSPLYCSLYKIH